MDGLKGKTPIEVDDLGVPPLVEPPMIHVWICLFQDCHITQPEQYMIDYEKIVFSPGCIP